MKFSVRAMFAITLLIGMSAQLGTYAQSQPFPAQEAASAALGVPASRTVFSTVPYRSKASVDWTNLFAAGSAASQRAHTPAITASVVHVAQTPSPRLPLETLPAPVLMAEPLFDEIVNEPLAETELSWSDEAVGFQPRTFVVRSPGVGRERVIHAPFEVDTTQPLNYISFALDLAYDFEFPNRAEYLWAGPNKGPGPEDSVNYQDFRFKFEFGGKRASVATEIPIRGVDPDNNPNHAGLGDVKVTTKTVFLTRNTWQITQILRTHINTGSSTMGLGTGHLSLEPGLLARYKVDDSNYIHGALQYWFPIAGDPMHSGEVLSNGVAWSRLMIDRDDAAWITSLEAKHWMVMDGLRSTTKGEFEVDGVEIFNVYIGSRLVHDTGNELGLVEYGVQLGSAIGGNRWYQNMARFDIRFSF